MFLILCLPRSRSAWLAHYLSYGPARPPKLVGHEILGECDSVQKFLDSYHNGMWGTCETAGAGLWRIVRQELPECQIVLIRRPLVEVHRSLIQMGLTANLTSLAAQEAMLDAATSDPRIISIPYTMLSEPFIGKWLFEVLLQEEFDFDWWMRVVNTNIQVKMPDFLERLEHAQVNLNLLAEDIKRWPMAAVSARNLN
jgi:hypothetical protein